VSNKYEAPAAISLQRVEAVPIIIPKDTLEAIGEGYEFVETLHFPQKGVGGIYGVGIARDIKRCLATRPIPGSKFGHNPDENHDDFFVIGAEYFDEQGKVLSADAETGELELGLRVRVPPSDFTGNSNDGFIRSIKTGNQRFSLVLIIDDEPLGGVFEKILSDAGLRNDAVGTIPAMKEQTVIANSWDDRESAVLALIKGNKICEVNSAEMVVDGFLNLTAVRNIRPLDSKFRNRILNAVAKAQKDVEVKMTEEDVKKLVEASVKDAVGSAVSEAIASLKKAEETEQQTKKNSADREAAEQILGEARAALGEGFKEATPTVIFAELAKLLGEAQEHAAEVAANKFLGDKFAHNSAVFTHCKGAFKSLGKRVFNKEAKETLIKTFENDIVLKELRKNAYNPAMDERQTTEFTL
jgi:hypothetical protein